MFLQVRDHFLALGLVVANDLQDQMNWLGIRELTRGRRISFVRFAISGSWDRITSGTGSGIRIIKTVHFFIFSLFILANTPSGTPTSTRKISDLNRNHNNNSQRPENPGNPPEIPDSPRLRIRSFFRWIPDWRPLLRQNRNPSIRPKRLPTACPIPCRHRKEMNKLILNVRVNARYYRGQKCYPRARVFVI